MITLDPPIVQNSTVTTVSYRVDYDNDAQECGATIKNSGKRIILFTAKTTPSYSAMGQWQDFQIDALVQAAVQADPTLLNS
jgi:hypothetical protein